LLLDVVTQWLSMREVEYAYEWGLSMSMMPDIQTNKFRREAEECGRNAKQAMNPKDRDAWLRLADDWMKLARGEDLRIKIVTLRRLRNFTVTASAGSDDTFFHRARGMYRPTRKTLQ
jgi:hypothetical protein